MIQQDNTGYNGQDNVTLPTGRTIVGRYVLSDASPRPAAGKASRHISHYRIIIIIIIIIIVITLVL